MEILFDQVCANCGNDRTPDGRFCLFCGDVLTGPEDRNDSSSESTGFAAQGQIISSAAFEYAGFWRRLAAGAIDVGIEAAGAFLITYAIDVTLRHFGKGFGIDRWSSKMYAGFAFIPILAVGSWLYCAFAESSPWRATVGKRLLELQVITADGDRTSFGQATIRHFMKFLSLFCLTIGFLMAGWTKRRQALHDIPCDCLVIRVPQRPFSLLG
jgi:uncharacterized RDD family membrane protein YckC